MVFCRTFRRPSWTSLLPLLERKRKTWQNLDCETHETLPLPPQCSGGLLAHTTVVFVNENTLHVGATHCGPNLELDVVGHHDHIVVAFVPRVTGIEVCCAAVLVPPPIASSLGTVTCSKGLKDGYALCFCLMYIIIHIQATDSRNHTCLICVYITCPYL